MSLTNPEPPFETVAARVQARLASIEAAPAPVLTRPAVAPPPPAGLHGELEALCRGVDRTFQQLEARLGQAMGRCDEAVARADRAELRSAAAEARLGDLVSGIDGLRRTLARTLAHPDDAAEHTRLRDALDRLRQRATATAAGPPVPGATRTVARSRR